MTILREISFSVLNFLMCYLLLGSSRSSAQKIQVGAFLTHGVPLFSRTNLGHDYYLVYILKPI